MDWLNICRLLYVAIITHYYNLDCNDTIMWIVNPIVLLLYELNPWVGHLQFTIKVNIFLKFLLDKCEVQCLLHIIGGADIIMITMN
jgi:hypothetical protein